MSIPFRRLAALILFLCLIPVAACAEERILSCAAVRRR